MASRREGGSGSGCGRNDDAQIHEDALLAHVLMNEEADLYYGGEGGTHTYGTSVSRYFAGSDDNGGNDAARSARARSERPRSRSGSGGGGGGGGDDDDDDDSDDEWTIEGTRRRTAATSAASKKRARGSGAHTTRRPAISRGGGGSDAAATTPGTAAPPPASASTPSPNSTGPRQQGNCSRPAAWSDLEERRFIEALNLYGRSWRLAAAHVGTRDANNFRSHAQKYFIKLFKEGRPVPARVAESGAGHTLSGRPLDPSSAAARAYLQGAEYRRALKKRKIDEPDKGGGGSAGMSRAPMRGARQTSGHSTAGMSGARQTPSSSSSSSSPSSPSSPSSSGDSERAARRTRHDHRQRGSDEHRDRSHGVAGSGGQGGGRAVDSASLASTFSSHSDDEHERMLQMAREATMAAHCEASRAAAAAATATAGGTESVAKADAARETDDTASDQLRTESSTGARAAHAPVPAAEATSESAPAPAATGLPPATEYARSRPRRRAAAKRTVGGMYSVHSETDSLRFLDCKQYDGEDAQPFRIVLQPRAALVMDLHAHCDDNEVIGFLGGRFHAARRELEVVDAFPCRALRRGRANVGADVSVDASPAASVGDVRATARARRNGVAGDGSGRVDTRDRAATAAAAERNEYKDGHADESSAGDRGDDTHNSDDNDDNGDNNGDNGGRATEVELDPESAVEARQAIEEGGLEVLAWYHSHPTFRPEPSVRDADNQRAYQMQFEGDRRAAFVGAIIGPYDSMMPRAVSATRWFHIVGGARDNGAAYLLKAEYGASRVLGDGGAGGDGREGDGNSGDGEHSTTGADAAGSARVRQDVLTRTRALLRHHLRTDLYAAWTHRTARGAYESLPKVDKLALSLRARVAPDDYAGHAIVDEIVALARTTASGTPAADWSDANAGATSRE